MAHRRKNEKMHVGLEINPTNISRLAWDILFINLSVPGRFGPLYRRIYFPIDDEGLYDEPIVHAVGEIARVPDPITFQYRMNNRLIGF